MRAVHGLPGIYGHPSGLGSGGGRRLGWTDFLTTEMTANPQYKGVCIAEYDPKDPRHNCLDKATYEISQRQHFSLSINFVPGAKRQNWQLNSSPQVARRQGRRWRFKGDRR